MANQITDTERLNFLEQTLAHIWEEFVSSPQGFVGATGIWTHPDLDDPESYAGYKPEISLREAIDGAIMERKDPKRFVYSDHPTFEAIYNKAVEGIDNPIPISEINFIRIENGHFDFGIKR